jgi:hypothetical protein
VHEQQKKYWKRSSTVKISMFEVIGYFHRRQQGGAIPRMRGARPVYPTGRDSQVIDLHPLEKEGKGRMSGRLSHGQWAAERIGLLRGVLVSMLQEEGLLKIGH